MTHIVNTAMDYKVPEIDGVLVNAEPRISIVTNKELRIDYVQRSVNAVDGPEFLRFEEEGKSHKIILDSDRVSFAEVLEILDEYLDLSGDEIISEFTMIKPEIDVEGKFTGIDPIVRGSRVNGDVVIEVNSSKVSRSELVSLTGPSMSIVKSRGKYTISDDFASGVVLSQLDTDGVPTEIFNDTQAETQDIVFASRVVTTDITDTFGL